MKFLLLFFGFSGVNNNLTTLLTDSMIKKLTGLDTIASLYEKTMADTSRKFRYNSNDLPSDYPSVMSQAGNTFNPVITVNRFGGVMYLQIISPNQTSGIPKIINGYYNGNYYWSSIQG